MLQRLQFPCILCLRLLSVAVSVLLLGAIPNPWISVPLVVAATLHALCEIHKVEADGRQ
ncbi:hypothetical protein SAMN07250955_10652 [Arboricoccus pini]|uniref:Uncharacterized protein n=1 Tax=Arboricoccus pini TaxID=1963835 RepID=A0A212R6K5_9PROT|nr:hypothetical protein [Arboricoccus pini]SNB67792.1 hypothetical protein SAMN07250955_10652 [Arboricoccus pini]